MKPKTAGKEARIKSQLRSERFRILGSKTSEKKAAAVRANGRLGGRPRKAIQDIPCTCGGGDTHKSYCLRGKAVKRRNSDAADVERASSSDS